MIEGISQCNGCIYWVRKTSTQGKCHFHAPKPSISIDTYEGLRPMVTWPLTFGDDFCSEWVAKSE